MTGASPSGAGPDPDAGRTGTPPRRLGELAALVSALTAVVGLLLALFGVPFVGNAPTGAPTGGVTAVPPPAAPTPTPTPTKAAPGSQPAPPAGWRRVTNPALAVSFAVPDGWKKEKENAIQTIWKSADGTYDMSVKRDTSYGATAQAAADGQLAWYRRTADSSMADVRSVPRATRQGGKAAVWLEIDYHGAGQTEPRKRVEVFVAGDAGRVYQLLIDTVATPERLAKQRELFGIARAQLRTDVA
ncbi:hypothetical protein [Streptomyces sp. NPDC000410]|uniref:hypothetical protein n=1 Tax=Streptomyces sp. NPDC000410 TaxID=3154254 RepID=UPI0033328BE4